MPENQALDVAPLWRAAAADAVVLDGFHAVKHALRFGAELRLLLTTDKAATLALAKELADDTVERIDALAREVPEAALREVTARIHPTGVIALASRPSVRANLGTLNQRPRQAPVVVLENPRNLGNLGAVIRLAAGLGATGVITTGDADPWHPNAVRAGAGLHFATAVERLSLPDLPEGPLYVLDPEGDDITSSVIPDDALLAFGTERHGVTAELKGRATKLLALPMRAQVSSYNLATSVAMTLYHWALGAAAPRS